jgi:hypothetical protein
MTPKVRLVHKASGRLRLRVAERREDCLWLNAAAERIAALPGVETVEIGVPTASLLVRHAAPEDIEPALRGLNIWSFEDGDPTEPPPLDVLTATFGSLNRELRQVSENRVDLQTLTFLLLVGLSIAQILRGRFMVPAASLLWYALELAMNDRSPSSDQKPSAPSSR